MSLMRRRMMMKKNGSIRHELEFSFDAPNESITFAEGTYNGGQDTYYKNFKDLRVDWSPSEGDFIMALLYNVTWFYGIVVISTVKSERLPGINQYKLFGFSEKTAYSGTISKITDGEFQYNGTTYYFCIDQALIRRSDATVYIPNLSETTGKEYDLWQPDSLAELLQDALDYYYGVI